MRRVLVAGFVALLLLSAAAEAQTKKRNRGNRSNKAGVQEMKEGSPRLVARMERAADDLALPAPVPYWQYKQALADSIHSMEATVESGPAPKPAPEPQFAFCLPNRYPVIDIGLCLEGRFLVVAVWDSPFDAAGPLPALTVHMTSLAGYFWFLDPTNPEVIIKELNGCLTGTPSHWIFASGMTNFAVEIGVRDLATGLEVYYRNPSGSNFNTIIDQNTPFPCP